MSSKSQPEPVEVVPGIPPPPPFALDRSLIASLVAWLAYLLVQLVLAVRAARTSPVGAVEPAADQPSKGASN